MPDGSNLPAAYGPHTRSAEGNAVTYATLRLWNEQAFSYAEMSGPVDLTPDEARRLHDGRLVIVLSVRSL